VVQKRHLPCVGEGRGATWVGVGGAGSCGERQRVWRWEERGHGSRAGGAAEALRTATPISGNRLLGLPAVTSKVKAGSVTAGKSVRAESRVQA